MASPQSLSATLLRPTEVGQPPMQTCSENSIATLAAVKVDLRRYGIAAVAVCDAAGEGAEANANSAHSRALAASSNAAGSSLRLEPTQATVDGSPSCHLPKTQ